MSTQIKPSARRTFLLAVVLGAVQACSPAQPGAPVSDGVAERPSPPLGQVREIQCAYGYGAMYGDSHSYEWRMVVRQGGSAELYDFESGAQRKRAAKCDAATFQQFAEALSTADFTGLQPLYLPRASDSLHPPYWSITATTSTGEWSVLAFTGHPPTELVAVQSALSAFKRTTEWRDV